MAQTASSTLFHFAVVSDTHIIDDYYENGTENSYHAGFAPSERKYMEEKSYKGLRGLDYHHAPLANQLSGGCGRSR